MSVIIDEKGSLSTGADSVAITDQVTDEMKTVVERATRCIPGLHVAGVDVLTRDHCSEDAALDYIIIEMNIRPAIGSHHFPAYGKPVNVARAIAESCVEKMRQESRAS